MGKILPHTCGNTHTHRVGQPCPTDTHTILLHWWIGRADTFLTRCILCSAPGCSEIQTFFYQTSARWWCEMSIIISVRWGWWPHIVESLHFFFHLLRPLPIMFDRSWSHLDRWIINHKDTSRSQNQCAMKSFVLHFKTFNGTLMSAPGKLCGATSPPANQVGQPDQPDLKFVNF